MTIVSVVDDLNNAMSDIFLDTDAKWRQVVLDHLDLIIVNSRTYDLIDEDLVQCQYSPQRYLRRLRVRASLYWIVMLINEWRSDADFHLDMPTRQVLIPTESYLEALYSKYKSSQA